MKSLSFTEVELDVSAFSEKGYGVGHLLTPSKTFAKVEIAHAIPGDRVKINLQRKRKGVKKGKLLEILTPSSNRIPPKCSHARLCGGCTWQQMDYQAQLRYKEKIVLDSFQPFLKEGTALPIIAAKNPWHYRNKMEFTFSENAAKTRFLGLMIAHAASYVFNLENCFLANPWMAEVVNRVREWWQELPLLAYRLQNNSGHLRHLTLREGLRTGEKMIILTVSKNPAYPFDNFFQNSFVTTILQHFAAAERSSLSIVLRQQKIAKGSPTEISETTLFGKDHILETLQIFPEELPLFFRIGPSSFFQPNTIQAEILYRTGLAMLDLPANALVYDLYSGTGTLGMCLARRAKSVIGIEQNEQAVRHAQENISLNNITNFTMHQGDVGKVLNRLATEYPHAIVVDPPRAGLDPLALQHLKRLKAKNILYISCNPRTQAANVQELLQFGYHLQKLQPIDQFPHTAHIENIALLSI